MNSVDRQYLDLLRHILENGVIKTDRTGTGTISVFDYTMRFNMSEGFPLLTSKKMFTKGVIHELIWFLRGDTNIKYLVDNDVHIWDGDAYKSYLKNVITSSNPYDRNIISMDVVDGIGSFKIGDPFSKEEFIEKIKTDSRFAKTWGELGPVYGKQWRRWEYVEGSSIRDVSRRDGRVIHIDQISNLINDLKNNPDSRRLMVSAWNVAEIDQMTLPPCHYGFQCYTSEITTFERKKIYCLSINKPIEYSEDFADVELDTLNVPKRILSLKWNQRSVDTFLGLPFNIASYGLLLHILAKEVNMIPGELIFSGGDVHLYTNHVDQAKEQLLRQTFDLPNIKLTNKSIDNLKYEDIQILDYKSDKVLKGDLSN